MLPGTDHHRVRVTWLVTTVSGETLAGAAAGRRVSRVEPSGKVTRSRAPSASLRAAVAECTLPSPSAVTEPVPATAWTTGLAEVTRGLAAGIVLAVQPVTRSTEVRSTRTRM